MKKIIIIPIIIAVIGLIGFTLYGNKQEMKEEAKLAEVSSDAIPVKVSSLQEKTLESKVYANGILEAKTDLTILSETTGKVIELHKEKGATVKKGEPLAQVENEIIQIEVLAAKTNLEKLATDLERYTKLFDQNAVTKRQLEDIKITLKNAEAQYRLAKKRLDNTNIRATTAGKINNDFIQEGEFISMGQKLYEIVDASTLMLRVKLTPSEVLALKDDDSVKISTQVFPQKQFHGKVNAIASKADDGLKYEVEIEMTNNDEIKLKPGMYATAHFNFKGNNTKYYLNRNALIGSVQDPQVYVIINGKSELKKLTIGENHGKLLEVLSGIDPNDKVVMSGQINLSEGTKVKVLDK